MAGVWALARVLVLACVSATALSTSPALAAPGAPHVRAALVVSPDLAVTGQVVHAQISGTSVPDRDSLVRTTVDWGDGSRRQPVHSLRSGASHRYRTSGRFTVTLAILDRACHHANARVTERVLAGSVWSASPSTPPSTVQAPTVPAGAPPAPTTTSKPPGPQPTPSPSASPTPTTGSISGRVVDAATRAPISGVEFQGFNHYNYGIPPGTGADGTYTIPNLAPGAYTICSDASGIDQPHAGGYKDACYSDDPAQASTPVIVTAGTTTTGVDLVLTRLAGIVGTVVSADGAAPLGHVDVTAYDATTGAVLGDAFTQTDGTYTINRLVAYDHVLVCVDAIYADGGASATGYAGQCSYGVPISNHYLPRDMPMGLSGTTTIALPAQQVADADFTLSVGGELAGTVTAAGAPVGGVLYRIFDATGVLVDSSNYTASDGTWAATGITPEAGPYTVCFDANYAASSGTGLASSCYVDRRWLNSYAKLGRLGPAPNGTTGVSVVPGGTTGAIDVALSAGGAITGSGWYGNIYLADSNHDLVDGAATGNLSSWTWRNLTPSSYYVCSGEGWDGHDYYPTGCSGSPVTVTAGATTSA